MKLVLATLLATLLVGCAANGTPLSMQYCSEVTYARKGTDITIDAKCQAPVQPPQLPGVTDAAKAVGL